ncbi:hypothetical protein VNO80_22994 [Phaseolus coccineus]|uniref:Uncharacterized protein n=1 Tax=Phaseolus coccineus TaxID=3886 RepID=A0AAN9QUL1_PHACN
MLSHTFPIIKVERIGEKRWERSECGLVVLRPLTNDVVLSTEYVDLRRGTPYLSLTLTATNSRFFLIHFSSFRYISYICVQVQQISLPLLSYTVHTFSLLCFGLQPLLHSPQRFHTHNKPISVMSVLYPSLLFFLCFILPLVTICLAFVSDCNATKYLVPVLTLRFWPILVRENDVPSCVEGHISHIRNGMNQLQ